ncbi:DEAD (Asp-Glu-Ala-Asp) box polypeptide 20 [Mortierella polycephala]|uniref:RNA helicase n=1 Tax=Mortierella polycephala TaxID=41804 RepID=A0A9P6Q814_9FUNG|nr:DEAD (Asp-Glu-Ala-Asp) box polypeptide 20 [Mortierella polycephala]
MLDRFHSSDVQINEDLNFSSLVSNPELLKGLTESGYQRPSPIQLKTIPLGRLGLDLIAQAKSGTGKTVVFSVIAIESIISALSKASSTAVQQDQQPRAVILAPTREIAVQIQDVILNLVRAGLKETITCHSMIGGMPIHKDKENLRRCSIVVGTPGRVRSLIDTGHLRTSQVRLLVLDEADKLMEEVFKDDVFAIAKGLGSQKQVMAFSATYDDDLLSQLDHLVKNPVYVMLSNGTPELADETQKSSSVFMRQTHLMEAKFAALEALLTHVPFYQAIVFLNHRSKAADLVKFLTRKGWPAMHIASGISQEERLAVMDKARKFELRVLVCSDLIARGIDIDRVNMVVNLDLPKDPETYLHRIGRTGRYGTAGLAVSLVHDAELRTVEILRQDFGITIQELSADDNTYVDLHQHSKNRHHERPLKVPEDQEQFIKLEAERIAGQQRGDTDDVIAGTQDDSRVENQQHDLAMAKRPARQGKKSKKKRRVIRDETEHSPLTPEQTPPVAGLAAESAPRVDEDVSGPSDIDHDALQGDDGYEPLLNEEAVDPPYPYQYQYQYPQYPHNAYATSSTNAPAA